LRFNFVVAAHPVSALHSSVFARLASGAFYETIVFATFYEIINYDLSKYLCSGWVYIFILSRSSLRSLRALR